MKILLATRIWPAHRPGGMPHVAYDRAAELARLGHDVTVITTAYTRKQRGWVEPCRVVYADTRPQAWSADFCWAIQKLGDSGGWDVIHSDSFDREHPWFRGWRGAATQAVTMHGPKWGTWLTQRNLLAIRDKAVGDFPSQEIVEEQNALAAADRVLAISRWEYRMLRDHYRLPQTRLVYNPIGAWFFPQPDEYCFDYATLPKRRRTYFLSAAITGQRERVFAAAQEACRTAGVEWREVRALRREDMPAAYDGAIAVVNPTCYAQGYDLTVAEGRARGCPAILGATGSYLDEADPRWDRLVEPGSAVEVAEAVRSILSETRDFAADMAAECRARHLPAIHVAAWLDALT